MRKRKSIWWLSMCASVLAGFWVGSIGRTLWGTCGDVCAYHYGREGEMNDRMEVRVRVHEAGHLELASGDRGFKAHVNCRDTPTVEVLIDRLCEGVQRLRDLS